MRAMHKNNARLGALMNYDAARLAALTGASLRTARRWRSDQQAPAYVVRYLFTVLDGDLSAIDPAFTGWHIRQGILHTCGGWTFTPRELLALPLHLQELAAIRRELACARQTLTDLTARLQSDSRLITDRDQA